MIQHGGFQSSFKRLGFDKVRRRGIGWANRRKQRQNYGATGATKNAHLPDQQVDARPGQGVAQLMRRS